MKQFSIFLAVMAVAGTVMAQGLDKVVLAISNVSTGTDAATVSAASTKVRGYIERIDLNFTVATNLASPSVIASNTITGKLITLLHVVGVSTGAVYMPRMNAQDINADTVFTNDAQRFVLFDDVVFLSSTNAANPQQGVRATVIYERK